MVNSDVSEGLKMDEQIVSKDLSKKMGADYKIRIEKVVFRDDDFITMKIKVSDDLKALFEKGVVRSEKTEQTFFDTNYSRYLIKRLIRNSLYWNEYYNLCFSEALVDTGVLSLKLSSHQNYQRVVDAFSNLKNFVVDLLKILNNQVVNIEYNVRS